MPADPIHHTATTDAAWDGGAQEKKIETPVSDAAARLWAWHDPDGDGSHKGDHKFPHHMVNDDGTIGASNNQANLSIISVLNGGMGGADIPDTDRQAVYDHAAAHLKDAKVDAPELKSARQLIGMEERRSTRDAMRNVRETRLCPMVFELRDVPNGTGGTDLLFTGYASVTDKFYEMQDWVGPFEEQVVGGAFRKTLDEGCDVAFLLNHEGMTLARTKPGTLMLAEHMGSDPAGLHVEARLDPRNPIVAAMRSAIERGDLDEMSFAFRVIRQQWVWAEDSGAELDQRYIQEVNLNQGDVSLVNYGANPHTGGTVVIRKAGQTDWRGIFETYAAAERELREGKTISAATLGSLQQIAGHIGDSDTAQARSVLQSLIDSAASGAAGNSETESASAANEIAAKMAEAAIIVARNQAAEKRRRGWAA